MKKVTIITVAYNAEDTIEQTIDSVLNLLWDNIEYIVIDGGSSDGTQRIIREHEERITYWISEKDQGIYDAMNKGVKMATGEWIAFLNCGDTYYRDALDILNGADEEDEIVYGYVTRLDKCGIPKKQRVYSLENILHSMICCHQGVFVRRRLFQEIGLFNCSYKIVADYEWLLKSYLAGKQFRFVDHTVASYMGGGVSEIQYESAFYEYRRIAVQLIEWFKLTNTTLPQQIKHYWRRTSSFFFLRTYIDKRSDRITAFFYNNRNYQEYRSISIWGMGKWGNRLADYFENETTPVELYIDNFAEKYDMLRKVQKPERLKWYNGIIIVAVKNEAGVEEIKTKIKEICKGDVYSISLVQLAENVFGAEIDEFMSDFEMGS